MRVHTLVIHVHHAILGLIVLHADSGLLGAHPVGAPAGERRVRACMPQDPRVELGADAVLVRVGRPADHLAGGGPVLRQLSQARAKRRVDVTVQDLGGRVDVRIGVPRAETSSHGLLLLCADERFTLGGGLRPPSEPSPHDSIARAKPALEAEPWDVGDQSRASCQVTPTAPSLQLAQGDCLQSEDPTPHEAPERRHHVV